MPTIKDQHRTSSSSSFVKANRSFFHMQINLFSKYLSKANHAMNISYRSIYSLTVVKKYRMKSNVFYRTTYVIDPSSISMVSFVAYFLAKSNAEKLFTARRLINNPSKKTNCSSNAFILHIDRHINGVTSVNVC